MTTTEQAELRVVLRWMKGAILAGLGAAFSFGVWVARVQSQAEPVPQLVVEVRALQDDRALDRQVMRDFMLLTCARRQSLNETEQGVCDRYQPRPR